MINWLFLFILRKKTTKKTCAYKYNNVYLPHTYSVKIINKKNK